MGKTKRRSSIYETSSEAPTNRRVKMFPRCLAHSTSRESSDVTRCARDVQEARDTDTGNGYLGSAQRGERGYKVK